ncbi:hypothetical protein [Corynebacterium doosanense]|nr:hypothetical protein [Corynebacterium doosanense]
MGQEFFGGPEYFQEFDPEKFARELKAEQERQERRERELDSDESDDQ